MTNKECCDVLLDFIYDRGIFKATSELEGMAVSQKPDFFVQYYSQLPQAERVEMNRCLTSSLLGKEAATEKFAGIIVVLLLAVLERVPGTGLEAFQSDLVQELRNPRIRHSWLKEREEGSDFRQNWRYALGIINILNKLYIPAGRAIAMELAGSTQSIPFRQKLNEILLSNASTPAR